MKVLVTGNKGYIGSVLTEELIGKGYQVVGLDTDYYDGCALEEKPQAFKQIKRDSRDITREDLDGIDGVIHLAALSNDPLGELKPGLTDAINLDATVRLAKMAREAGIKRFVYASSQSMYGIADTDAELDEDKSTKTPLTAYARAKWDAECALMKMVSDNFVLTAMRPSTVFGASPKLRCDIVFNYFVGCAYTTGKIEVKSDGTPWRPAIHIRDVSSAFIAGLEAPAKLINGRAFNVGLKNGNYTVRELAEIAQKVVPGSKLTFTGEHGSDARTYRVGFSRILSELRDYYKPEWDLMRGGLDLVDYFNKVQFTEDDFRGRKCTRLQQIKHLLDSKKIDESLKWRL